MKTASRFRDERQDAIGVLWDFGLALLLLVLVLLWQ